MGFHSPREPSDAADFTGRVIEAVRAIPPGRVATYGQIAALAGNYRAARQVVRVLHACSEKKRLPWYRVINCKGRISLPADGGYDRQKKCLLDEGIDFDEEDVIDLHRFLWQPDGYGAPLYSHGSPRSWPPIAGSAVLGAGEKKKSF